MNSEIQTSPNENLKNYLVVDPETGEIVAKIDRWYVDHVYSKEFIYKYDPRFEYV